MIPQPPHLPEGGGFEREAKKAMVLLVSMTSDNPMNVMKWDRVSTFFVLPSSGLQDAMNGLLMSQSIA